MAPHRVNSCSTVLGSIVLLAVILIVFVRPLLSKIYQWTRTPEENCPPLMVFVVLFCVCGASFITQAIGVHAIFGAFLIGIVTPKENHFHEKLTEKIEDFISVVFLPLVRVQSLVRLSLSLLGGCHAPMDRASKRTKDRHERERVRREP